MKKELTMKFNKLHSLLEDSVVNENVTNILRNVFAALGSIINDEYYLYPGMKQFKEEMRTRLEARNEQNYKQKWSEFKDKDTYDTMEEACQALDQSIQTKSRKKFSDWFIKKMQTIYTANNININTKNPTDTINNSYIMFGEFINPLIGASALNDPKLKSLLDKFYIDDSLIDSSNFNRSLVADPTKSGMKNWIYSKTEIQKLAATVIKNMTSIGALDDKMFAQSLTLCFTSIKDSGKSTSFMSNLDFIIMATILSNVFKPAYASYLTKSKFKLLESLCNNNKADYDIVVDSTITDIAKRLQSANNIIKNFTTLINDVSARKTTLSDKLFDHYTITKRTTVLNDNLKKIKSSMLKSKGSDKQKLLNAKIAWDLGFELYGMVKVEEEKLIILNKVFNEISTELNTMPQLVDKADIDASQNFIIPKIKK